MNERKDIIIADTLRGIGKGEVAGYLCHAYCHKGFCEFNYNNNEYRLEAGECLIIRRGDLVESVKESEDFEANQAPKSFSNQSFKLTALLCLVSFAE